MRKFMISLSIIIILIALQIAIYSLILKKPTSTWGASIKEISASMPGDDLSEEYQSTRAITINAPLTKTWVWLNQFGADRSGFFSYYFIEQLLGYQSRPQSIVEPKFPDLVVGDLIRGSINPSKSIIIYEFEIIATKPENYIVAKSWGTFLLRPINDLQTRLIIRTHRPDTDSLAKGNFDYYIAEGLHFIMERATLMGFKARVETGAGPVFDNTKDKLWFFGIVASAFAIAFLTFIMRGIGAIIIPTFLSTGWTFTLLILDPVPINSLMLLALVFGLLLYNIYTSKTRNAQVERD